MTCGDYAPSQENLHLRPLMNTTITRDDASLLIVSCDIVYCLLFLVFWKYMEYKVNVVVS